MKKIVVLLATGFEEVEFCAPVDILRRMGLPVVVAGVTSLSVQSARNITMQADCLLSELNTEDCDALILPGGAGSWILKNDPKVICWIQEIHGQNKLIGAICAAPIALAQAGIIQGKRLTAFPAPDVLQSLEGAIYTSAKVEQDGKLITAQGAGCALAFGYALARFFCSEESVAQLEQEMIYHS